MRIRSLLLPAALPLAAGLPASAQESVSLDFGWTPGTAEVEVVTSLVAGAMGQSTQVESRTTYRLTAYEKAGGLRVSYSDFTFDGAAMQELMSGASRGEDLSQVMADMQPDILVSPEGRFVALADYAALRASMEEMVESMRTEMEAMGAGAMFDQMMDGALTEEAMTRNAELAWNQLVGDWAGRTLTVGETVSVSGEMPVPMFGTQPVAVETELRLVGRTACGEDDQGRECLELTSRAVPDGEAMRNLMDVFMAEMMEGSGGTGMEVGITEMALVTTTSLIVEAATLRPLRIQTQLDTTIGMDMMGMVQTIQNAQEVVTRFVWSPS